MVAAGWLAVDSWRDIGAALVENWHRVLLSVLGGLQLLMAAGASPALMVIGGLGGVALIAAAWLPTSSRTLVVGLVVVGTLPFAVLGVTAVVPVLVAVLAGLLTIFVLRGRKLMRTETLWSWLRLLIGGVLLWGVLAGLSEIDATGRYGLIILVLVAITAVVIELVIFRTPTRTAVRFVGLGRPRRSALVVAAVVSGLILLIYPLASAVLGVRLRWSTTGRGSCWACSASTAWPRRSSGAASSSGGSTTVDAFEPPCCCRCRSLPPRISRS